jgi:uroporphyrinogen-III synthase
VSAVALSGRGIVITRPCEHAAELAERVRAAGGEPILFPTIEIRPPEDSAALARTLAGLGSFDLAIFVSPTAAMKAAELVGLGPAWPRNLRTAAVGAGTAAALQRLGFESVVAPKGEADSEALAGLAELQDLRGRSAVIFRGQGGREWLRAALEARGARVEYAECYRRVRPKADTEPLVERWRRGGIDAVSITSSEGLGNFFDLLAAAGKEYLRATPVFVPHQRIAAAAARLGVRKVVVTGRGDEQTVAGMSAFFARV